MLSHRTSVAALALGFSLLSSSALAGQVVVDQTADARSYFGQLNKSYSGSAQNWEVADDFEIIASIDSVTLQPLRAVSWSAPMPVAGVTVRFYSWNNGVPGALQAEHFVQPGANLEYDSSWQMSFFRIKLPQAFSATGKHFVSFQVHIDETMHWWTANSGAPKGASAKFRNRNAGTAWTSASTPDGPVDGAFLLNGILIGDPVITSLSAASLPRSGQLIINGKYFGGEVGQVMIDGKSATIAGWNQQAVKAYVPETASLGTVNVTVIGSNGVTAAVPLDVTTRKPEGKIKWKFKTINAYTEDVPVVGPDGTVFVHDSLVIYALSPEGALKWLYGELPYIDRIDVGPDGTLYTACNDEVVAINPNGTVKWKFDPPFDGNWPNNMGGPNVGPDGNIYMVHDSIAGGLGVYSLNPQGQLRWKYAPLVGEYKPKPKRIAFTGDQVHVTIEHESNGSLSPYMDETLTLGLDGSFRWRRQYTADGSPAAGTNGDVYALRFDGTLTALTHAGNVRWVSTSNTTPAVGPDGTLYGIRNYGLYQVAIDPATGQDKWSLSETDNVFELHNIAPNNSVLMGSGNYKLGSSPDQFKPYLQSVSKTGQILWRQYIPNENDNPDYPGYGYILPQTPAFSKDGSTAYYGSFHNTSYGFTGYTYVYAVDTSSNATPDEILNAGITSQSIPVYMVAGQSYMIKLYVKNTGNTAWTAGNYYLAGVGETGDFNRPRVDLATGETIQPGQTKMFNFTIWAPMTGGDYFIQYRMAGPNGMFGQATGAMYPQVVVWAHAAQYGALKTPTTIKAGSSFTVTVRMRNVGTKTWTAAEGFMLRNTGSNFGVSTVPLASSDKVARGYDKTFTFTCKAPTTPGIYKMKWRMYRAGTYNQFFGDTTTVKDITVVP